MTTKWVKGFVFGALAACAAFGATSASAQQTMETVKNRGKLICGVSMNVAGFAYADSKGVMQGFDADVCRAVAAAVLGAPDKIDFVLTNINTRFQALQSGEIDILSRQTTMTYSREASLGVKSAKELKDAAICILPGTTTLQNLADFFRANSSKFESVVFENPDELRNTFFSGRCDALSSDRSDLASIRAVAKNPADYVILPETISKEPLAPAVRQGDPNWRDIVSLTVEGLIAAEEKGITQANIDEMLKSEDPEIQRMLGVTGDLGPMLGLDNKWLYNAIKGVGNYGEMFERNLGEKTPLGLTRGPNQQWTNGGLLYAAPFR